MGSINYPDPQYAHPLISERSIDESRPLKVIYLGAGVSGIVAAIKFPEYVPNIELTIYEKNADIGGTWSVSFSGHWRCTSANILSRFENRYPGCACGMYAIAFHETSDG
jgi:cation diffusion facilitator CzcD-associated flavoprotein CzcO